VKNISKLLAVIFLMIINGCAGMSLPGIETQNLTIPIYYKNF